MSRNFENAIFNLQHCRDQLTSVKNSHVTIKNNLN